VKIGPTLSAGSGRLHGDSCGRPGGKRRCCSWCDDGQECRLRARDEGWYRESLPPAQRPDVPGLQIGGRSLTAATVGGDAFDFILYPDAQLGLDLGRGRQRVAGGPRGPGPSSDASCARQRRPATAGHLCPHQRSPRRLSPTQHLHHHVLWDRRYPTRRIVYANAGHPPPLVLRADGRTETLVTTGPALGFPVSAPLGEAYADFGLGDGLVLFTDGVTDVGLSPDAFFDVTGVEAMARALWSHAPSRICEGLLDEVRLTCPPHPLRG
jgi:sigma-B regulation protein RsbU (phosphoserine phosphatase)